MQITCGFTAGDVKGQKSWILEVNKRGVATMGPGRTIYFKLEWTAPVKLSGQQGFLLSWNGLNTHTT